MNVRWERTEPSECSGAVRQHPLKPATASVQRVFYGRGQSWQHQRMTVGVAGEDIWRCAQKLGERFVDLHRDMLLPDGREDEFTGTVFDQRGAGLG
jgi:hypothetical protein